MDTPNQAQQSSKKPYIEPKLVDYGNVRVLAQAGTGTVVEPGASHDPHKKPSERRVKENIVRIGTHPLRIGLYLFDYKPGYREAWGPDRKFGVMADEVEKVMPEAVSVHPDGYKVVNYGLLGMSRPPH